MIQWSVATAHLGQTPRVCPRWGPGNGTQPIGQFEFRGMTVLAAGCAVAWILLLMSAVAHAMHYCGGDECDSA